MATKQGEELWNATVNSPTTVGIDGSFAGSCYSWSANSETDPAYIREQANGGVYFECREGYHATCTGSPTKYREQIRVNAASTFLGQFGVGQWIGFSIWMDYPNNSGDAIMAQFNGDGAPEFQFVANGDGTTLDIAFPSSDSSGTIEYTNPPSKVLNNWNYPKNQYIDVVIYRYKARLDDSYSGRIKIWINDTLLVDKTQANGIDYLAQGKNGLVRFVPGIYPAYSVLASGSTAKMWIGPVRIYSGSENDPDAYAAVAPGQAESVVVNPYPAGTVPYTILDSNFTLPDDDSNASWRIANSTVSHTKYIRYIQGATVLGYTRTAVFTWTPAGAGNSDVYLEIVPKSDRSAAMPVSLYSDYGGGSETLLWSGTVDLSSGSSSWQLLVANQYHNANSLSVVVSNAGLSDYVAVDGVATRYVAASAGSDVSFTFVDDGIYDAAATTYTANIPTSGDGLAAGDIMFIWVVACGNNSWSEIFNTPSGWSSYCNTRLTASEADRSSKLFYKVATGSESGTVSVTLNQSNIGKIVTFFGTNIPSSNIFSTSDTHAINADGTYHSVVDNDTNVVNIPAITPSAAGAVLTLCSGHYGTGANTNDSSGASNDGSETKIYSSPDDGASAYMPWTYISYQTVAAAGTVAAHTVTFAGVSNGGDVDTTILRLGVNKAAVISSSIDVPDSADWTTSPSAVAKNYGTTIILDPIGNGEFSGGSEEFILLTPTNLVGCSAYIDKTGVNDRLAINVNHGFDGTLSLTLPVSDTTLAAEGGPLTDTCTVSFDVNNTAPVATDLTVNLVASSTDVDVSLVGQATDADGDSITYSVQAGSDTASDGTTVAMNGSTTARFQAGSTPGTGYTGIVLLADDGSNVNPTDTINVTVNIVSSAGTVSGTTFNASCTRADEDVIIDFLTDGSFTDTQGQQIFLESINGSPCTSSGAQVVTTTYGAIDCVQVNGTDRIRYNPNLSTPYGVTLTENISIIATNNTNSSSAVTMVMTITTAPVSGDLGWITGWESQ